ncbi:MAG: hypothetical protein Q4B48_07180 [Syntrophomonadaceae bacterium]|nr:hypothetical protein [Syntrophomonadaceae bacterium]
MVGKLRYILILIGLLILFCAVWVAYNHTGLSLPWDREAPVSDDLLYVRLVFSDDASVDGYVKGLGIEAESQLYNGGSSCNYIYDKDGAVIGAFNYQRLLYILLLPEPAVD